MKILLVNVDNRWSLAIRRMHTYYTQQGHEVEMRDLGLSGYPHNRRVLIDASGFDQVHVSNIFELNADRVEVVGCEDVEYGGIGSRNPERQLPAEIEACHPYYAPGEKKYIWLYHPRLHPKLLFLQGAEVRGSAQNIQHRGQHRPRSPR